MNSIENKVVDNIIKASRQLKYDVDHSFGEQFAREEDVYKYRYYDYLVYKFRQMQLHVALGYFEDFPKSYRKAINYDIMALSKHLEPIVQCLGEASVYSARISGRYDLQSVVNSKKKEIVKLTGQAVAIKQVQVINNFVRQLGLPAEGDLQIIDQSFRPTGQASDVMKYTVNCYPDTQRYKLLTGHKLPLLTHVRKEDDSVVWHDVINDKNYPVY